ncbi:MAG: hypothetical protein JWR63_566 [Conexibacter sp.]|nr:hypothetical protein [Conexibacter sp.]
MLLCLVLSAPAQAVHGKYWEGFLGPQQQNASSTLSNLRATGATGTDWVGAAAHVPGSWTLYGSYITGWGNACHTYAAGSSLGAMMKNDSGLYNQFMGGYFNNEGPSCA